MNSKRKGSQGEREILEILSQHGEAQRNDQRYIGGYHNPDISFKAYGRDFHTEVKRVERLSIREAVAQAESDAAPGTVPIVVHRRNRQQWHITLRLSDFFDVVEGNK